MASRQTASVNESWAERQDYRGGQKRTIKISFLSTTIGNRKHSKCNLGNYYAITQVASTIDRSNHRQLINTHTPRPTPHWLGVNRAGTNDTRAVHDNRQVRVAEAEKMNQVDEMDQGMRASITSSLTFWRGYVTQHAYWRRGNKGSGVHNAP